MVLELYVWGPALDLPSIDPECLGMITYFTYAVPKSQWRLVASSPSALPSRTLPALHDRESGAWACGFRPIISYVSALNRSYDLDADLTAMQKADTVAYSTFLSTHAAPLIALSLYVSSTNWAAATRPAYSKLLPFPLTWTEPPSIRATMSRRAEHLGLSSLDTDSELSPSAAQTPGSGTSANEAGANVFHIPASLRLPKKGVSAALSPEQAARIRLDGAAEDCLSVLDELKGDRRFFFFLSPAGEGDGLGGRPSALDCLAFGYLALMLVPDVPRPWLADAMKRRHAGLCAFVEDVRKECFLGEWKRLLWVEDPAAGSATSVARRFAVDLLRGVPVIGEESWAYTRKEGRDGSALLLAGCGGFAGLALLGSFFLYRHLQPFGAPMFRWEAAKRGLGGFGAAGSFLGFTSEWLDAQYSATYSGGVSASTSAAVGEFGNSEFGDASMGVQGKPPVAEVDVVISNDVN